jgi:membrane protein YqaA with SNARE-associated domain
VVTESLDLWGLFVSAFISSTLLPGGSEVVLAVLAHQGARDLPLLLTVATTGNTLGGMSSWAIGRLLPARRLDRPAYRRAVERIRRWGSPALLLSWLPIVGDPLCVAGGWLRIHWLMALVMIAAGKAARYAVILFLV